MGNVCPSKKTLKILSLIEDEKLGINLTISGSDELYRRLDNYFTRVSLALISAGLGIASSLVIQAKIAPMIWGVSFLGILGYAMAVILGMWVVFVASKKTK